MKQTREVLRLHLLADLSSRKIQGATGVARTTVQDYIKRCKANGLTLELMEQLDDDALSIKLFGQTKYVSPKPKKVMPDYNYIHRELKQSRKDKTKVTLMFLWEAYKAQYGVDAYEYTQFRVYYRRYKQKLNPSMRQIHKAGEKVFIDFSGVRQAIADPLTGEITYAEIFVAVLGASGYPFVIAVPSQKKADFIYAHNAMFKDFEGVPELLVPDNLKSAVTRVDRYEPDLNPDYVKLAEHYGTAIMPARRYKPQDKSLVENGVKLNITPKYLLVAPENETKAKQLLSSESDPSANNSGVANVHRNTLDIVVDSELEATPWYLAAPRRTIKVLYLQGTGRKPIVRESDRNLSGVTFECVFDFGVYAEDFRGLYKNAGA